MGRARKLHSGELTVILQLYDVQSSPCALYTQLVRTRKRAKLEDILWAAQEKLRFLSLSHPLWGDQLGDVSWVWHNSVQF